MGGHRIAGKDQRQAPASEELKANQLERVVGGAICNGVSMIAWARVDGESLQEPAPTATEKSG